MNKKTLSISILLLIASIMLAACQTETPDEQPVVLEELPYAGIIAEGTIEPEQSAVLSFGDSGLVQEFLLEEGDSVSAGDVIARLTSCTVIEGEIKTAQSDHLQVQQALDELERYAGVERETALQNYLDVQDTFHTAQEDWDDFDMDDYEDDLGDAQEDVQDAETDLEEALEDLEAYLNLEEDNPTRQSYQDDVDEAERDLHQAQRDLDEVERDYLQTKLDFDLATSQLAAAEVEYEKKKEGPDADQFALLQAQSEALQQTIQGLQSSLDNCQIVSPIDGFVMKNDLKVGEYALAGDALIMVADTSQWIVKTDDLSEYDVVNIAEGQSVEIRIDAFPGVSLQGVVDSIDRVSYVDLGDVTYPVTISITDDAEGLRWGMSASVILEETGQ